MNALENVKVATPERVALDLPVAGVGHRTMAYLVDLGVLFFFWVCLYFVYSLSQTDLVHQLAGLSGFGGTLLVLGMFATQWMYWSVSEVLFRGRTAGKRAMGIRVVRQDGSPVTFFESAVRNFVRAIDFLPIFYVTGLVSMMFTQRHLRLGDLLAGTVVIREEKIDLSRYAIAEGSTGPVARLDTQQIELVLQFLGRAASLEPAARLKIGESILERLGAPRDATVAPTRSVEQVEEQLLRFVQGSWQGPSR